MIFTLAHPCDKKDNGGCSQVCNKDGEEAACACHEGFELTDDEKSCKESKHQRKCLYCIWFTVLCNRYVNFVPCELKTIVIWLKCPYLW